MNLELSTTPTTVYLRPPPIVGNPVYELLFSAKEVQEMASDALLNIPEFSTWDTQYMVLQQKFGPRDAQYVDVTYKNDKKVLETKRVGLPNPKWNAKAQLAFVRDLKRKNAIVKTVSIYYPQLSKYCLAVVDPTVSATVCIRLPVKLIKAAQDAGTIDQSGAVDWWLKTRSNMGTTYDPLKDNSILPTAGFWSRFANSRGQLVPPVQLPAGASNSQEKTPPWKQAP